MKILFTFLTIGFLVACSDSDNKSQDLSPPTSLEQGATKMRTMRGDPNTSKIPSLLDDDKPTPDKQVQK